jgi:hypothetical protein
LCHNLYYYSLKNIIMATTTAVPSNSLTLKNPAPPPGVSNTPANRFILFGNGWLDLQTFISQALQLPINIGDFTTKYGTFNDQKQVQSVLDAMIKVQNLSSTFGDPTTIRDKIIHNGSYLSSATPPSELYGHIVWLANQIENTASSFSYTFGSLSSIIGPSAGTPEQRAQNLKDILVGRGGLVSMAADMQQKTATLSSALALFDSKMAEANTQMLTYTGNQSQIIKDANTAIGTLTADRDELQKKADEAYAEWRAFTIAAVVASVSILVLSCGLLWPVAAAVGGGLGIKAGLERGIYNGLMDQVAQKGVEIGKKTLLLTDLNGLNTAITPIQGTMTQFMTDLQTIEGVWVDIGANLQFICTNYGVEQLSDLPWVTQALKIGDAQNKWQLISNTASQFTQNSLVTYATGTPYGTKIA